jgi:hypothetical protein
MVQMPNLELVETKRITVYVCKVVTNEASILLLFLSYFGALVHEREFLFSTLSAIFSSVFNPLPVVGVGCRGLVLIVSCI